MLRYICQNPIKAGLSNEPFTYPWLGCAGMGNRILKTDDIGMLTSLKNEELVRFVSQPSKAEHLDENERKRLTDRVAMERLKIVCNGANVQDIAGWEPEQRDKTVVEALSSGISIRQLSRLTGISKAIIERIRNK